MQWICLLAVLLEQVYKKIRKKIHNAILVTSVGSGCKVLESLTADTGTTFSMDPTKLFADRNGKCKISPDLNKCHCTV